MKKQSIRLIIRFISILFLAIIAVPLQASQATQPVPVPIDWRDRWHVIGTIRAIHATDQAIYVGGVHGVYPSESITGPGIILTPSGQIKTNTPIVRGYIEHVESDQAGGWFVAGQLILADDTVARLAHIRADNSIVTLWPWHVTEGSNTNITQLLVHSGMLYISGGFTSIDGQARKTLAAFDIATETLLAFDPFINDPNIKWSQSMEIHGTQLYLVSSNGQFINHIKAIDLNTATPTSFDVYVNGSVHDIAIHNNTLYVGGLFSSVAYTNRTNFAEIDVTTGNLLPNSLPVNTTWEINNLLVANNHLYINTVYRANNDDSKYPGMGITAVNLVNNTVLPYTIKPNAAVTKMLWSNNTLYIGGFFTKINEQDRLSVAALNATTGALAAPLHNLVVDTQIYTFAFANNELFIGGSFRAHSIIPRYGLAAFDPITADLLPWNPVMDKNSTDITTIVSANNHLYVGGMFKSIDGQTRGNFAAFDISNGPNATLTNLSFNMPGQVTKLLINDDRLYLLGSFNTVDTHNRKHLAAIDIRNGPTYGTLTDWAPTVNGFPNDGELLDDRLYIVGEFTQVNGQTRTRIAAFDIRDNPDGSPNYGTLTNWSPQISSPNFTYNIAANNSRLYLGSRNLSIDGQARKSLAAFDIRDNPDGSPNYGTLSSWNPQNLAIAGYLMLDRDTLFSYGSYTYNPQTGDVTNGLIAFDIADNIDGSINYGNFINWQSDYLSIISQNGIGTFEVINDAFYVGRSSSDFSGSSALSILRFPKQLQLLGNGQTIASGSATPTILNGSDFGSQLLNASTEQSFVISNNGSTAIKISSLRVIGTHAGEFTIINPPATTIAPYSSTTLKLAFKPIALGTRSAIIEVFNDLNGTYSFSVQGTGSSTLVPSSKSIVYIPAVQR